MFTDSAESAESDVEVDFDSGADGSLVANGSPDGEGGDSVGVFCESNAIGPRALGLSGSFTGGSGFLSRVVGSAFGSGAGVAVVSGWADAIFASLSLRVTASATSFSRWRVNLGRNGFGVRRCRQSRHGGRRIRQLRAADTLGPRWRGAQPPANAEFLQRVVYTDGNRPDHVDRERDRIDGGQQRCLDWNTRAEVTPERGLDHHAEGLVQRRQNEMRNTEAAEGPQDRDNVVVDDVVIGVARRTLVDQVRVLGRGVSPCR